MVATVLAAAIAKIEADIPPEILDMAFKPELHQQTIDERIIHEVVRKRILVDLSAMGVGKQTRIPLIDGWREVLDSPGSLDGVATTLGNDVYRIPADARENRDIISVQKLVVGTFYSGYDQNAAFLRDSGNSVSNLARVALGSRTLSNQSNVPEPYLIGNNLVRVRPRILSANLLLECQLSFDPEFTNVSNAAVNSLSNLILNATKTYVYTRTIVAIDANEMRNGMPIGVIKEIVSDYRDEKQAYQELLLKVKGNLLMDPDQARQLVRLAL